MLVYFLGALIGFTGAVAMVCDRRLSAQKKWHTEAECPAMERGAWLTRRYIEVMGVASLTFLAVDIYFWFHYAEIVPALGVALALFLIVKPMLQSLDARIIDRHGHSERPAGRVERIRAMSESELERWVWRFPLIMLIVVGGSLSVIFGAEARWAALGGWIPFSIMMSYLLLQNRRRMVSIVLSERTQPAASAIANRTRRPRVGRSKRRKRK